MDDFTFNLFTESSSIPVDDATPDLILNLGSILRGPKGDPGPPGDASTYIFDQSSASATWMIDHELGRFPSITIVDSTGREVIGDPQWVDANHIIVNFSSAFAGQAFLN